MSLVVERFRFGFQYLYRYFNLSFSQSDVPDLPDWPIKLFKTREKVPVVEEEVKSEPLYYHINPSFSVFISYIQENGLELLTYTTHIYGYPAR